ncbi:MAG: LPS export ABC transporter permease LptF [Gammaproteobacteria bacterium]|nr:LPS export ABC transporter permease LptF [Gammaproteobacteria bacterium]
MILERYLFREVLQAFVAVFGVLVLIFVSNRFVKYLADAATGELANHLLLELLAAKLAANLILIMPLAYFVSVLMTFGRLYSDSEITALVAGGVSPARLLWSMAGLSVAVALAGSVMSTYIAPEAQALGARIEEQSKEDAEISGVVGGRFREFSSGRRVFFAERISRDRSELENVFVHRADGSRPVLVAAESGYQFVDPETRDRFMVLVNGHRYEGRAGEADIAITRFREYGVRMEDNPATPGKRRINEWSTLELLAADGAEPRAELQWRLSLPLSIVLLGPLGVLVARTSPRQGRFSRLFYGILIYFVYNNMMGVGRELVRRGDVDTVVGMWPVHLLILSIILVMYRWQVSGRRPLWQRLREHRGRRG